MIKVNNISYSYDYKIFKRKLNGKNKQILENVSFEITNGEYVSLTGLNGCGKSTLIKILLGILVPQQGSVEYDGISVHAKRIKTMKNIGVVWGQKPTLWWDVPVSMSLNILKNIYGVNKNEYEKNITYLNSFLFVSEFWDLPLRKLSLGQRVRAELFAALIHMPKYLILDEPFVGLDYKTVNLAVELLKDLKRNSDFTLLLTSHQMEEIEGLCKKIIFLRKKNGIISMSIEEIKNNFSCKKIIIHHNSDKLVCPEDLIIKTTNRITELLIVGNKIDISHLLSKIMINNLISDIKISDYSIQYALEHYTIREDLK